ncbi:DUF7837 family putative zinc-binding protein [Haloplanus natans]
MAGDHPSGCCPNCGHDIRPVDHPISYERSDRSVGVFAECPSCGAVVEPEENSSRGTES